MKKVSTLILASPFPQSSSEKIARQLEKSLNTDWTFEEINLSTLPADDLLLRTKTPSEKFNHSVKQIMDSDLIIIATPTYRATYTGLLNVFFDLWRIFIFLGEILPNILIAKPGPGKGCVEMISLFKFSSKPNFLTSSLNKNLKGSTYFSFIFFGDYNYSIICYLNKKLYVYE